MSVIAMAAVFKAQGLTPTHKLVLLSLADHANDEGRHIYPSIPRTSAKTGLSERTVQRTIRELEEKKLLSVIKNGGGRQATEYKLDMDALNCLIPPEPPKKGCHGVTPAVTECHPSGDTVTPLTIIEPSDKHQKDSAKPDPRTAHPAIQAIRTITGRYPSKDVYDTLIQSLGECPDSEKLSRCWQAWRVKDFKPTNYGWVTDWYPNGIPQNGKNRKNGNGKHTAHPHPDSVGSWTRAELDVIMERDPNAPRKEIPF